MLKISEILRPTITRKNLPKSGALPRGSIKMMSEIKSSLVYVTFSTKLATASLELLSRQFIIQAKKYGGLKSFTVPKKMIRIIEKLFPLQYYNTILSLLDNVLN